MPIANCVVGALNGDDHENIIGLWSRSAGIESGELTINFLEASSQQGKKYGVMATLYLPSIWPAKKIDSIETSLAEALSIGLGQPIEQIHIITQIVQSGHVVEDGNIQRW